MSEELDRALEKMTLARLGESYAQVIEEREELRTQLSAMTAEGDKLRAELTEAKRTIDELKFLDEEDTADGQALVHHLQRQLAAMTERVTNLELDISALYTNEENQKGELKEKLAGMTALKEKAEAVCKVLVGKDISWWSEVAEALTAWREASKHD